MARGHTAQQRRRARRARRNVAGGPRRAQGQDPSLTAVGDLKLKDLVASVTVDGVEMPVTLEQTEDLAVSGDGGLPLSDREAGWDAAAATKTLKPAQFAEAHFWKDPAGPADEIGSYKLPFAQVIDGKLTAVWGGITGAAGAVQGARGGVKIPSGDVAGVKGRIGGYYTKAAKQYDDAKIEVPWKGSAGADTEELADAMSGTCANCDHGADAHMGEMNDGACTFENCNCAAFEAASVTAAPETELATAYVRIRPDLGGFQSELEAEIREAFARVEGRFGTFRVEFDEAPGLNTAVPLPNADETEPADTEGGATNPPIPEAHQPSETLPPRRPTPNAPTGPESVVAVGGMKWTATLAPEGSLTDDGRAFAPGSITWRELPLTLMAMTETSEGGHIGAEVAGRIDRIWREGDLIRAEGVFDSGTYGTEIARLVGEGTLRGVSVDLAIHEYEIGPRSDWFDEQGNWAPQEPAEGAQIDELDLLYGNDDEQTVFVVTSAVIGMTTVCPFPAFADATIALAASLIAGASPGLWTITQQAGFVVVTVPAHEEPEATEAASRRALDDLMAKALTASAAGLVPARPPADWFNRPEMDELTPLTITEEGRIYGHAWEWESCHLAFTGTCVTPPHSVTGNAYFHLGEIECDDGSRATIGKITLDTGHADRRLGRADATRHYDDTGTIVAYVVSGEDEFGGWFSGTIDPEASEEKIRILQAAVLSGDWRNVNDNLELVALLAVNVPGFPVPRARALVATAGDGEEQVLSLVAAGIRQAPRERTEGDAFAEIEALAHEAEGTFEALAAELA